MAIETVGGFNKLLSTGNSKDWVKSADLNTDDPASLALGNGPSKAKPFSEMLAESIGEVNSLQVEANKAMERLTSGQTKDVASVMLAAEKADIAFRAMNNVRSKVIEAYKEIMRMQV